MRQRTAPVAAAMVATIVGLALPTAAGPAYAQPPRPVRWLAAGDSFSSGTGLTSASGPCTQASGVTNSTYAQVAAKQLGASVVQNGSPDLVACSGAHTSGFFTAVGGHPPQWTSARGRYDLVTFTFGGDDVDFAPVLTQCVGITALQEAMIADATTRYSIPMRASDPGHFCPREADLRADIDRLVGATYQDLLTRIATQVVNPGGDVVVLGYPEIVETPDLWTGVAQAVDLCFGINRADALELRGLAGDLNATIGYAVSRVNASAPNGVHLTFLDVNSGSAGIARNDPRLFEPSTGKRHNQCAIDSWLNGITSHGPFHPDQRAHDAEGSMLADVIGRLSWPAPAGAFSRGAGGGGNTGTPSVAGPLRFAVTGSCTSSGGTLTGASGGFTPSGHFTVAATYPDGSPYPLGGLAGGTVHPDGTVSWTWPCAGDPTGTYHTTLTDTATGRGTGPVAFMIGSDPGSGAVQPRFPVMNTSEQPPDGVWFRNSPQTADTDRVTGNGVYAGDTVQLRCYGWGDQVGPYQDTLWYVVSDLTRPTVPGTGAANTGWLNAHYIDDKQNANVIDVGVPPC